MPEGDSVPGIIRNSIKQAARNEQLVVDFLFKQVNPLFFSDLVPSQRNKLIEDIETIFETTRLLIRLVKSKSYDTASLLNLAISRHHRKLRVIHEHIPSLDVNDMYTIVSRPKKAKKHDIFEIDSKYESKRRETFRKIFLHSYQFFGNWLDRMYSEVTGIPIHLKPADTTGLFERKCTTVYMMLHQISSNPSNRGKNTSSAMRRPVKRLPMFAGQIKSLQNPFVSKLIASHVVHFSYYDENEISIYIEKNNIIIGDHLPEDSSHLRIDIPHRVPIHYRDRSACTW
jgi:hypothetical protein